MKNYLTMMLVCILLSSWAAMSDGQQKSKQDRTNDAKNADGTKRIQQDKKRKTVEFIDQYNARHLTKSPTIGDSIEQVEIFDGRGKAFSSKQFHGKHTVLVFGCLT